MAEAYKIINRKGLDEEKYNFLLASTPEASIYNHLSHLDYLADQSKFIVMGDYQGVMALPYTKRLNSLCLTNPVYSRMQDWLGQKPTDFGLVIQMLKEHFDRCDFSIGNMQWSGKEGSSKVTQFLAKDVPVELSSQAKRNIKKLSGLPYSIVVMDKEEALVPINQLLLFKIGGVRDIEVTRFNRVIHFFDQPAFVAKGLFLEGQLLAVGIFLEWRGDCLFIKGTNTELGKDFAAMQTLMMEEIRLAKGRSLDFQFEGSNVESVARFNHSFGAKDISYLNLKWDHSSGLYAWVIKWLNS